jgi:hypothetical protein
MRDVEKRILHEERRPNIKSASDLLGPGLAPFSIWISDWNAPETTFNGLFHSEPGAFNTPVAGRYWMGSSQATADGYGLQRVTEYRGYTTDVVWPRQTYVRKFFTVAESQRQFSPWRLDDGTPVGLVAEYAGSNIFVPLFSTANNATAWTVATGWSIARQETRYVAPSLLHTDVELLRTGAAINVGTTGDVANVLVATLSSEYSLLSGQNALSSGQVGRTAHFNVYSSNRELSLTSLGGSVALAVNEDLSFGGVIPVRAATNATTPTAPNGWLVCNGTLRDIVDYPDLYAVIGTKFNIGGEPGGQFRLPAISGKVIKA